MKQPDMHNQQHIVIIGGGFAGLAAAQELRNAPVQITLIDKRNHHLFQPLLYQVATGELSPADIASPLRRLLKRQSNIRVVLGDVITVDTVDKQVLLRDGRAFPYDKLIVAAGASNNYFNNDAWQEHAPGLKTIEDALYIRRRILRAFEAAEGSEDADQARAYLTFVIIGGGPTGVEMAGALSEIAHKTFKRGFHNIKPADARIILIQSSDRILPTYHPASSRRATRALQQMGVEVMTQARVVDVKPEGVMVVHNSETTFLPTYTPIWAVGVQAVSMGTAIAQATHARVDYSGRIIVGPDCRIPGQPDIFVIGDLAHFPGIDDKPLPGVAQVAIQQGKYAARSIKRELRGKQSPHFHYSDRGMLATIGNGTAIAEIGPLRLSGLVAWKIWLFIHLMYLLDFENRVLVIIQWIWNFFTGERSALLIVDTHQLTQAPTDISYTTDAEPQSSSS